MKQNKPLQGWTLLTPDSFSVSVTSDNEPTPAQAGHLQVPVRTVTSGCAQAIRSSR